MVPVVEALAAGGVAVSVDTRTPAVAGRPLRRALRMLNDVSRLARRGRRRAGGAVGRHAHAGRRRRPCSSTRCTPTSSTEVRDAPGRAGRGRAGAAGVPEVWIDPGIGFGKTRDHNLELLAHLDVLVGHRPVRSWSAPAARRSSASSSPSPTARPNPCRPAIGSRDRWPLRPGPWLRARRWCGCTMCGPPSKRRRSSPARCQRAADRDLSIEQRGTTRRADEGQVGPGDQAPQLRVDDEGPLAVCERPGGYGANHRRVRRQEEIIWIREQGFTCVISLIPSPHNLHNYEELGVAYRHLPFGAARRRPRPS